MIAWSLSTNDIPVSYGFEPHRSKGDATRAAQKFEDYLIGLAAWTVRTDHSWACATPDLWYRYHVFWFSRMNLIISRREESWGDQAAEAARQVRQVYSQKHLSAKFADWFTRQGKVWYVAAHSCPSVTWYPMSCKQNCHYWPSPSPFCRTASRPDVSILTPPTYHCNPTFQPVCESGADADSLG